MRLRHAPALLGALAALLVLAAPARAQRVHIVDSGTLYSTYDLRGDAEAMAAIRDAVSPGEVDRLLEYAHERNWPRGIASLGDWSRNRDAVNAYVAYHVASFGDKEVLVVPAAENQHMIPELRPSRDIYFVIGQDGVRHTGSAPPSSGQAGYYGARVRIADPMQLYSTYDLRTDAFAMAALRAVVPPGEIDRVIAAAHEDAWPAGIATFERRAEGTRDLMPGYTAYRVASFGGKQLLAVPAAENQGVPASIRPARDFFLVLGDGGVEPYAAAPAPPAPSGDRFWGRAVRVTDPMQLYSTYDLRMDADAMAALRRVVPARQLERVLAHAHENFWPAAIATFERRAAGTRDRISNYNAYLVAEWGDKVLVAVPVASNGGMYEDMRPTADFFMVIGRSGVNL